MIRVPRTYSRSRARYERSAQLCYSLLQEFISACLHPTFFGLCAKEAVMQYLLEDEGW